MRRAPAGLGQPCRFVDWRWTADVMFQQTAEFGVKGPVVARREVGAFEFLYRFDQRFGNKTPAEFAEVAARRPDHAGTL